ncbi:hypothetical protein MOQ72_03780 [Saccharopolyspora sp. K220]|uniref:hypothetical protein n=1 Tax=Saccharopolyspora soli TaxID=2926618 RepID=UPI001F55F5C6|nr:hypothetical protein [Saccharopolyspora soli]MCI2416533.1 hypothetical protein [Saccharopolyspora soli]
MTIDPSTLDKLRQTLAADDYQLAVAESETEVRVSITAGPGACAECLVPKPLMRGVLHSALGVPEERITLIYPGESEPGENA